MSVDRVAEVWTVDIAAYTADLIVVTAKLITVASTSVLEAEVWSAASVSTAPTEIATNAETSDHRKPYRGRKNPSPEPVALTEDELKEQKEMKKMLGFCGFNPIAHHDDKAGKFDDRPRSRF